MLPITAPSRVVTHAPHIAVYFALGLVFAVTLTKSRVVSWFRIQEMFGFQAFHTDTRLA